MTNPLEQAFPDGAKNNGDVIRYLAEAFVLVWDDASTIPSEDFSGTPYKAILISDAIFEYDPDDTITSHDGINVLKTLDNRVYKLQERLYLQARVLDKDLVAQPSSPSVGDAYILTAAPTGADWNSKAENIATYTQRGWSFKAPETGIIVFVEDESAFYHYSSGGDWTLGLGDLGLGDGTVKIKNLAKKFGVSVVAEQSDPPVSIPADGVGYIVTLDDVATGDWTGQEGKVAISNGMTWDFFTPQSGDVVFDLDVGYDKKFEGSIWQRKVISNVLIYRADYSEDQAVDTEYASFESILDIPWTGKTGQVVEFIIHSFRSGAALLANRHRVVKDLDSTGINNQFDNTPWERNMTEDDDLVFLRDVVADELEHTYSFQVLRGAADGDGTKAYFTMNIYEPFDINTDAQNDV